MSKLLFFFFFYSTTNADGDALKGWGRKNQMHLAYLAKWEEDSYALFVSALIFSENLFIFQRAFSRKLSQFPVFGNDFENELENVF